MKKIMIAFAAVAMAACAQAATVTWSATGCGAGNMGYFFDEADIASTAVIAAIKAGTFDGTGALRNAAAGKTGAITQSGIGSYGGSATTADPEFRDFYMVLFDAGSIAAAEHYIVTSDFQVKFTSGSGSKPAGWQNVTTNYEWQSIPEPTSGLLLLLGVAGLALKRKRA